MRGSDVFMLALTQSGIPTGGFGEEVPAEYIRRLKRLDSTRPTYVVLSEFNADQSQHPSFRDLEYLGSFPIDYIKKLGSTFVSVIRSGSGGMTRGTVRQAIGPSEPK